MNTTENTETLGCQMVGIAAAGFREYTERHNITVADWDAATILIKQHIKANMRQALDDAKDALNCGMTEVAEHTFRASMVLAGIAAAKELSTTK